MKLYCNRYCGHGDGSQFTIGGAEKLSAIKAVAILSGCSSVSLRCPGTRILPIPTHSHFHTATWYTYIFCFILKSVFKGNFYTFSYYFCSPSVIGMLWEVTDVEVDKVTSMLVSLFVPSNAPEPWGKLNKSQWTKGILGKVFYFHVKMNEL